MELAWEAGCGSGQLTVPLARRVRCVVATDASLEQLRHAAAVPNVRYCCARAEHCGLLDHVAELAIAAQAAHWFDLDQYFNEVRRVARPGALVALVTYGRPRLNGAIDTVIRRFHDDVLTPFWPPERRHVEAAYSTLPFPFEEPELLQLEMRMRWTLPQVLGYVDSWSAVRALEANRGKQPMSVLSQTLEDLWADIEVREISWPLTVRTGRV